MSTLQSTLKMLLLDGVSGPAATISRSLRGLDNAAAGTARRLSGKAVGAAGLGAGVIAGRNAAGLVAAGAGMVGAVGAGRTYAGAADYDRQLKRILITAEASDTEMARVRNEIVRLAQETAVPIGQVTAGLDSLVAAGRSLPDALGFLPAVVRTAQASGSDVTDIARTADAVGAQMKIRAEDMQQAFDAMAKAGKAGKFELKDMAEHLPSIAALAGEKGFRGQNGLNELLAMLQMIRTGAGSSGEAATYAINMLQKISLDETAKKFKKFGVDIKKIMADTRKQGGNEFLAMMDDIDKAAQKGAQVSDLFQDQQAQLGYIAYRNARGMREKLLREIANSTGTVANDLSRVVNDSKAAIDRLSNSWTGLTNTLAMSADKVGVPAGLQNLATELEKIAGIIERINSGDLAGAGKKIAQYIGGETEDDKTRRQLQAILHTEDRVRQQLGGGPEAAKIRGEIDRLEKDDKATNKGERLRALRERLRIIEGRDGPNREEADRLRREATNRALDLVPALPAGPSGGPDDLIPREKGLSGGAVNRNGIRTLAGFPTRRQREGAETSDAPSAPVMISPMLDDASLSSAVEAARARAQALADAAGPIRFRAEVSAPSGVGVTNRLQGAQSDPGTTMGPR